MTLSSLAQEIYDAVTAQLPTLKTGLTLQSIVNVPCKIMIDPAGLFEEAETGLFIVPITNRYDISNSNRRGKVKSARKLPTVGTILSLPFISTAPGDVSSWEEIKDILEFRERVEDFITTREWSASVESVEAEPPLELRMNTRWFMGICEFTFEYMSC